jgi:hypothetical protein
MSKKTVTPLYGKPFEVNTSDEAISKLGLGFKYGDRITHPGIGEGTIIGVAPATGGSNHKPDVLWCAFDKWNGKVSYTSHPSLIEAV